LLEDQHMGRALRRLFLDQDNSRIKHWPDDEVPCFAIMFSLAGVTYNIELQALLTAFTWGWMENQVSVATKLIPLGQSAAQRILIRLTPQVEDICELALSLEANEIGCSLPGLAILSSRHERQSTRLFRS
jgi:urease accessory protein